MTRTQTNTVSQHAVLINQHATPSQTQTAANEWQHWRRITHWRMRTAKLIN